MIGRREHITQRSRSRRMVLMGGLSYSDWLSMQDGLSLRYKLDETGGLVALATNDAFPGLGIAASTDFPGADVAVNGSFTADSNWNKGVGVTIAGGQAVWTATTGVLTAAVAPLTSGIRYKVTIDIDSMSGDTMTVRLGTANIGQITSTGITIVELTANGSGLDIRPWSGTGLTAAVNSIVVEPANPLNLTNTGLASGQPGAGNIPLIYTSDGTTGRLFFLDITNYNLLIDFAAGGLIASVSASTWVGGPDVFHHSGVDATNFIEMRRNGAVLEVEYQVGGVGSVASFDTTTLPGGSPTGLFNFDVRWTAPGTIDLFVNGTQRDSTAIAAAIVGNVTAVLTAWFAANNSGGNSWSGGGGELGLSTIAQDDLFYIEKDRRSGL